MARLPAFIDYYRRLGVTRFFIVDNESGDGGPDWLLSQPDCHLYTTTQSYAQYDYGTLWIRKVQRDLSVENWCVHVDADEYFLYPGAERMSLNSLSTRVALERATAVRALLVDMYADAPLTAQPECPPGHDPRLVYRFFDTDSYCTSKRGVPLRGYPAKKNLHWGGMRHRIFGLYPQLDKVPFYKLGCGITVRAGCHSARNAQLSSMTAAVLHFKYTAAFATRVEEEVLRGEHWRRATEYVRYRHGLRHGPLHPRYAGSAEFFDSNTLVRYRLMREFDPETR
jgi:hypothetical protein